MYISRRRACVLDRPGHMTRVSEGWIHTYTKKYSSGTILVTSSVLIRMNCDLARDDTHSLNPDAWESRNHIVSTDDKNALD